jgi:excisionase family DNA binding protein
MSAEVEKKLLTYQEVAASAGISVSAVRQAVSRGEVTPSYFGRKPLIKATEFDRWVDTFPAERRAS